MNFFGVYTPSAAWLFALAAPIVLFYFLKLKRPVRQIPSLVLWRQVMTDQRVNSPFQKFKRNLLLLLQLLLLAAIALAAMQPYFRANPKRLTRLPILIDNSASMGALDKAGGATRLQAAKEQALRIIDHMGDDQQIALISFSDTARKRCDFTNNKRLLREGLYQIQVEDVPSAIEDALRMAQAVARSEPFDEALLLSDGNFPPQARMELSFKLRYQQLPPAGANIGVTTLNARRSEEGRWDILAAVEGSASAGGTAQAEFYVNDALEKSEALSLSPGKAERLLLRIPGDQPCRVRLRLVPDQFDSLDSDNTAWLDLPALRPLWVFCPRTLPAWRHALAAHGGVRLFPTEGSESAEGSYDLVVTDRAQDLPLPTSTVMTVGLVPEELSKLVTIDQSGTSVVDWQRNAPLLQHVELSDLLLLDRPVLAAQARNELFENQGYEILMHGRSGPLLLRRTQSNKFFYHLLFHSDRSTLPYRVGFPILVSNLVRETLLGAGLSEMPGTRTGVLPPLVAGKEQECVIEAPDGSTRRMRSDAEGFLRSVPAPRVGSYRISGGGREQSVGASLLDPRESSLAGVEQIMFNEQIAVTASTVTTPADRMLWPALLTFGFVVLMLEWWYFQRRPGGGRG